MSEEEYELYPVKNNSIKQGKETSNTFHPHPALLVNVGKVLTESNNSEEDPEPRVPYKRRDPRRRGVVGNTVAK